MKPNNSNVPPLARLGFITLEILVLTLGIVCMRVNLYNRFPVLELVHMWLSVTLLMASVLMFFRNWRLALSGIVVALLSGIRFPVF